MGGPGRHSGQGKSRRNESLARWMQGWMAGLSGEEAGKVGRGQTRRFGSQRGNMDFISEGVSLSSKKGASGRYMEGSLGRSDKEWGDW